jgi:hypothetical protein
VKENSIEEDIKIVENYLANSAINETDSNFFKNGGWETVDLEIPKSMQHILSDYKRALKENEELKEDRKNNNEMIALAQNEILNYMSGYEEGKKHKMTAVAQVVENQQYYIIKKQMEKYEEHIEKLQKENEELKVENSKMRNIELASKNGIVKVTLEGILDMEEKIKNSIPTQKVKDKMKKDIKTNEHTILGGRRNGKTLEYGKRLGRIEMCQELLEGRK